MTSHRPDYVQRLAIEKARAQDAPGQLVIAADTIVLIDQSILGKPVDKAQGLEMLMRLSGRSHQVMTGVALAGPGGLITQTVVSTVRLKHLIGPLQNVIGPLVSPGIRLVAMVFRG